MRSGNNLHIEGAKAKVLQQGPVANVLDELCQGIRSCCSYQGAHSLEELKVNPHFAQVSHSGMIEGRSQF